MPGPDARGRADGEGLRGSPGDAAGGPELASAYTVLGNHCGTAGWQEEAIAWAGNGLALAHRLGDTRRAIQARRVIGARMLDQGNPVPMEEALEFAQARGDPADVGIVYTSLVGAAINGRRYDVARRHLDAAIAFVEEHGLELYRYYTLSYRARLLLVDGRWDEAAEAAADVLRIRRDSIAPHVFALGVLGLLRARRGDPGREALLDEAWALSEPTGEPCRLGAAAVARAEAAWLAGDPEAVAAATDDALALAIERRRPVARRGARGLAVAGGPAADDAGCRRARGAQRLRTGARVDGLGGGAEASPRARRVPAARRSLRRRRWSHGGCASSASAASRAGRGGRPARTRPA